MKRRQGAPMVDGMASLWLGVLCFVLLCVAGCTHTEAAVAREYRVATPTATSAATQPATSTATATAPVLTATRVATSTSTPSPLPSRTPTITPSPTALAPLVALDPGHGGRDMGAPHIDADGKLDFTEAEVNLDIALRVRDILLAEGLRVFMIRDDDSAVNDPRVDINGDEKLSVIDESQARVDAINAVGADLLLSIHQNAYYGPEGEPAPDVGGTVTFYCADRPFAEDSLHFAELVQQNLIAAMNELGHDARNRGVMDDMVLYVEGEPGAHLIMLGPQTDRIVRPSNMPGCLSETMFLTHAKEAELARDPLAIDGLARAYANAVLAYFEQQDMPMDLDPE